MDYDPTPPNRAGGRDDVLGHRPTSALGRRDLGPGRSRNDAGDSSTRGRWRPRLLFGIPVRQRLLQQPLHDLAEWPPQLVGHHALDVSRRTSGRQRNHERGHRGRRLDARLRADQLDVRRSRLRSVHDPLWAQQPVAGTGVAHRPVGAGPDTRRNRGRRARRRSGSDSDGAERSGANPRRRHGRPHRLVRAVRDDPDARARRRPRRRARRKLRGQAHRALRRGDRGVPRLDAGAREHGRRARHRRAEARLSEREPDPAPGASHRERPPTPDRQNKADRRSRSRGRRSRG